MLIEGRCHCGNIAFQLDWEGAPPDIPARACTCAFCSKHGGVWTSNPRSRLTVTIDDPALVSKYAFGTRTATFHVCANCGTVPLVTSDIEDNVYAVVNVNAFENVEAIQIPDDTPTPDDYKTTSFNSLDDLKAFKKTGALLIMGSKPEVRNPVPGYTIY